MRKSRFADEQIVAIPHGTFCHCQERKGTGLAATKTMLKRIRHHLLAAQGLSLCGAPILVAGASALRRPNR